MKKCTKCGVYQDLNNFSPHKRAADGHRSACKKCNCEYVKQYYREHREERRAYNYARNRLPEVRKKRAEWKKTERVRAYDREYQRQRAQKDYVKRSKALWRLNNPEKKKAESQAQWVHKETQPCVWCGHNDRTVRHHPDYNRPLDIMWLCYPCHALWHKKYKAIQASGR